MGTHWDQYDHSIIKKRSESGVKGYVSCKKEDAFWNSYVSAFGEEKKEEPKPVSQPAPTPNPDLLLSSPLC